MAAVNKGVAIFIAHQFTELSEERRRNLADLIEAALEKVEDKTAEAYSYDE